MLACGPRPKHCIPVCGVGTQIPMRVCASRTHESPAKTLRTHQQHLTTCALCAIHVNSYHCGLTTIFLYITHSLNDPATTEIYSLSLHDALPIWNADTHACVCIQDARIPSEDAAYTLATLDDL